MKISIERILESVVSGSSERAGCNDGEKARLNEMIKLVKSKKSQDHETLYNLVFRAASYD